jgi:hypothetical protein
MKRIILASLIIIVLLAGFCLFPVSSTAQLFQTPNLFSYSDPYSISAVSGATGWPTGNWSNLLNIAPASSLFPAANANTTSFLNLNPVNLWPSTPLPTLSLSTNLLSNLSSSLSLSSSASSSSSSSSLPLPLPLSLVSPIPQFSLSTAPPSTSFPSSLSLSSSTSSFPLTSLISQLLFSPDPLSTFPSNSSLSPSAASYLPLTSLISQLRLNNQYNPTTKELKMLDYQLKTDQAEYGSGETVQIILDFSDPSLATDYFESQLSKLLNVTIKNSAGEKVWQLSSNLGPQICGVWRGYPEFILRWSQKDDQQMRVPNGSYTIEAFVLPNNVYCGKNVSTQITIIDQASKVSKVDYKVETDKAVYNLGEPIQITFTVTNLDKDTVTFTFFSTCQFDMNATTDSDTWVWTSSSCSVAFTTLQPIAKLSLAQGGSQKYEATWYQKDYNNKQQVPAGTYIIGACFTPIGKACGRDASIPITIVDPLSRQLENQ